MQSCASQKQQKESRSQGSDIRQGRIQAKNINQDKEDAR